MIQPIGVRFHKSWKPTVPGNRRSLSSSELQNIRDNVAESVRDAFVEELKKGGYSIVAEPGPDVLRVQTAILNLYITAPDVATAGRTRVYTVSAGEMTLLAELADSETGEIIVRILDAPRHARREVSSCRAPSTTPLRRETRPRAGEILRGELDKAKTLQ